MWDLWMDGWKFKRFFLNKQNNFAIHSTVLMKVSLCLTDKENSFPVENGFVVQINSNFKFIFHSVKTFLTK